MKFLCRALIVSLAVLSMNVAQAKPLPRAAKPEDVGFSSQRLQRLTETFTADVNAEKIPGAVILVARKGKVAYFRTGVSEDAGAVKIQQRDIDGLRAELTAATEPLSQKIESIAAERDDALERAGALDSELTKLRQVVAKLESANTAATKRIEKLTVTTEKLGKGVAEIKELKKEITKLQKLIRPPG